MVSVLPFRVSTFAVDLMLRITRVTNTGTPRLILSGRIGAEQLADVRRSVEAEQARDLVLDLTEVTLVDVEVVRFFLRCEQQGIRIAHCPAYVREWMAREKPPCD
jgi:hypothetical protein